MCDSTSGTATVPESLRRGGFLLAPDPRAPVALMALLFRSCLLAFCLVLLPAAPAAVKPASLVTVASPARSAGSVPLTLDRKPRHEAPALGVRAVRIEARELGVPYRYGGSSPSGFGHVGLYIGRGRIIHAPQSGERVEIQSLASRTGSVEGARRVVRS